MKPFSNCVKLNDHVTLIVIFMLNIAILNFVAIGAFLFHKHIFNKVMMILLSRGRHIRKREDGVFHRGKTFRVI